MALLQRSLDEPLLTRQQAAVCRDILRAAQLNEAQMALEKIRQSLYSDTTSVNAMKAKHVKAELAELEEISNYLKAEIVRVLIAIRLPKQAADTAIVQTKEPGKAL